MISEKSHHSAGINMSSGCGGQDVPCAPLKERRQAPCGGGRPEKWAAGETLGRGCDGAHERPTEDERHGRPAADMEVRRRGRGMLTYSEGGRRWLDGGVRARAAATQTD
jgi:hypothetical protein